MSASWVALKRGEELVDRGAWLTEIRRPQFLQVVAAAENVDQ